MMWARSGSTFFRPSDSPPDRRLRVRIYDVDELVVQSGVTSWLPALNQGETPALVLDIFVTPKLALGGNTEQGDWFEIT